MVSSSGMNSGLAAPRGWTVAALVRAVADTLGSRFGPVTVVGEISGFLRAGSGHCYFTLKDESAQLRCVLFRVQAQRLDFMPRDGDQVELRGSLTVYAGRGTLQLVVESLIRAGQGALLEQFMRLKARLESEGLFTMARKRSLPSWPQGIGVVTSRDAAALRDVITTLQRRAPQVPVLLAPAMVQGQAAPGQIAAALQRLYRVAACRQPQALDLILIVRGGGSLEDLWAFNDEALARVIATSPVPVVSGVGHETDFTISDFTADVRAATPTAAAELAAPLRSELIRMLDSLQTRLRQGMASSFRNAAQQLDGLVSRLGRPRERVSQAHWRLERLQARLHGVALHAVPRERARLELQERQFRGLLQGQLTVERQRLTDLRGRWLRARALFVHTRQTQLEKLQIRLQLLDPHRPLSRGYAWLEDDEQHPITRVTQVLPGAKLRAVLVDGSLDTIVAGRHVR